MPTGAGPDWAFFGELMMQFAPRAVRPFPPPPQSTSPDLAVLFGDAGLADTRIVDEIDAPTANSVLDRIKKLGD
jgi:hypothetical protein